MIQESTRVARLGNSVGSDYKDKIAKTTGLVGGNGLYSLAVGDKLTCGEKTYDLRERMDNGRKIQSPIYNLEDGRVISVGTIGRRNESGKFHKESTGMEILEKCQSAAEMVLALDGKTIEVVKVDSALLPVFGKPGETQPTRFYAWKIS